MHRTIAVERISGLEHRAGTDPRVEVQCAGDDGFCLLETPTPERRVDEDLLAVSASLDPRNARSFRAVEYPLRRLMMLVHPEPADDAHVASVFLQIF